MRKPSTLYENIPLTSKHPESLKLFINNELKGIGLMELEPNELIVKAILSYARALSVHQTKKMGVVNVILN